MAEKIKKTMGDVERDGIKTLTEKFDAFSLSIAQRVTRLETLAAVFMGGNSILSIVILILQFTNK